LTNRAIDLGDGLSFARCNERHASGERHEWFFGAFYVFNK
jgi:hypothetical protein